MTVPTRSSRVFDATALHRVRLACTLLLVYGVLVVANAIALQSLAGWEDSREFPRALLRLDGMLLSPGDSGVANGGPGGAPSASAFSGS